MFGSLWGALNKTHKIRIDIKWIYLKVFPFFFLFRWVSEECIKFFFLLYLNHPFYWCFIGKRVFYYLRDISVYTKLRIDRHTTVHQKNQLRKINFLDLHSLMMIWNRHWNAGMVSWSIYSTTNQIVGIEVIRDLIKIMTWWGSRVFVKKTLNFVLINYCFLKTQLICDNTLYHIPLS